MLSAVSTATCLYDIAKFSLLQQIFCTVCCHAASRNLPHQIYIFFTLVFISCVSIITVWHITAEQLIKYHSCKSKTLDCSTPVTVPRLPHIRFVLALNGCKFCFDTGCAVIIFVNDISIIIPDRCRIVFDRQCAILHCLCGIGKTAINVEFIIYFRTHAAFPAIHLRI